MIDTKKGQQNSFQQNHTSSQTKNEIILLEYAANMYELLLIKLFTRKRAFRRNFWQKIVNN